MDNLKRLKKLVPLVKKVREDVIAELRAMDNKDLAKLDPTRNRSGVNALCWKVRNYPSDLSLPRLVALLERKQELKL